MWNSIRDMGNNPRSTDTATQLEPFSSAMSSTIGWCCGSHFSYCFLAFGGGTTCARTFSTNWVTVVPANSATLKLPQVFQQAAAK